MQEIAFHKWSSIVRVECRNRGVAQSGSASGLGPEGRRFESYRPDHIKEKAVKAFFHEFCP